MTNHVQSKQSLFWKIKVTLENLKSEISIISYAHRYKISVKEAKEFKNWCKKIYYCKSYKNK